MIQVSLTETAANKVKELIQRNDPDTGKPLGTPEDTYLRMYVAGGASPGSGMAWPSAGPTTGGAKAVRAPGSRAPGTGTGKKTSTEWTAAKAEAAGGSARR